MEASILEVQALRLLAGNNPTCGVGIVKRFASDPRGGYGFILVEGSNDIIFHGSRGVVPFFSGEDNPGLMPWNSKVHAAPIAGNSIIYAAEVGERGLKATVWALWRPSEWKLIGDMIASRPLLRLRERKGPAIQSTKFKVDGQGFRNLWEGKNPNKAPRTRLLDTEDRGVFFEAAIAYDEDSKPSDWAQLDYDPRYHTVEIEPAPATHPADEPF